MRACYKFDMAGGNHKADMQKTTKPRKHKNLLDRNGTWYVRRMVDGKSRWKSTGMKVDPDGTAGGRKIALTEAKRIRDAELKRLGENAYIEHLDARAARKKLPTLREVLQRYRRCAAVAGIQDAERNMASLRQVAAPSLGADWESCRVARLDRSVVRKFAEPANLQGDRETEKWKSARRTVYSNLLKARSVFRFLVEFEHEWPGITEAVAEFRATDPEFPKPPVVKKYIPTDFLDRTVRAGHALEATSPGMFAAFWLAYRFGLRADEVAHCRRGWCQADGDSFVLEIRERPEEGFRPKSTTLGIIPVSAAEMEVVERLAAAGPEGGFLLPSDTITGRRNLIKRHLALWMTDLGWGDYRTVRAHALRGVRATIWATTFSDHCARTWMRHKDISTTVTHYANGTYWELEEFAIGVTPEDVRRRR